MTDCEQLKTCDRCGQLGCSPYCRVEQDNYKLMDIGYALIEDNRQLMATVDNLQARLNDARSSLKRAREAFATMVSVSVTREIDPEVVDLFKQALADTGGGGDQKENLVGQRII